MFQNNTFRRFGYSVPKKLYQLKK